MNENGSGNGNENKNRNENGSGNGNENGNGNGQQPPKVAETIFGRLRKRMTVDFFKQPSLFYLHVGFNTKLTLT